MSDLSAEYSPDSAARHPLRTLGEMGRGLASGRYMGYQLFLRDVRGDYSRSRFGIVWDFLEPLVIALVFIALFRSGVINAGEIHTPYPVFVVFGVLLWQTFSEAITFPIDIIRASRTLITQLKIMPESLLIAVFLRVAFASLFRIFIMLAVALLMNALAPFGFVLFLALFPLLILSGMAFGVLLAPFNAIYADVGRVVRIVLRPLMFATPVLWAVPRFELFPNALHWNPAATMIGSLRGLATLGQIGDLGLLCVTTSILALLLLGGWFIFHVSMPILAERV